MEKIGDSTIQLFYVAWSVGLYTSPIVIPYLYHRGSLCLLFNSPSSFWNLAATALVLFSSGILLRGYGRFSNPNYQQFLRVRDQDYKQYDFDFAHWPIEFRWSDAPATDNPPQLLSKGSRRGSAMEAIQSLPCNLISYVAVHTFGRRMMYPGSVALLQKAMDPMLMEGRTRLIERFGGERFKLETLDKNQIDTLLIDRRNSANEKGQKLVICCEGNAGFYEVGIMCTPIDAGYSVLGWNHPGFAGSTGIPFPDQEINAMDTVIRFARHKLGFKQEDIIVFAWSIGGFPCSWSAMRYPNLGGMILDATFDDILPLAVSKMPTSWKPLVVNTIRTYFNLNISENLSYFNGPVRLVRRLKDEIIHTVETEPIRTNRANQLLTKLLAQRFPNLFGEENAHWVLMDYLSHDRTHQLMVLQQNLVKDDVCITALTSYVNLNNVTSYPVLIGDRADDMTEEQKTQILLFLASKHMLDYDSTHCSPLPRNLFIEPWDLFREAVVASGSSSSGSSSSDSPPSDGQSQGKL